MTPGLRSRLAGAPITWGVCEVPGWGCQLAADRVLGEIAGLGLRAVELGPRGFLPEQPRAVTQLLRRYELRLAAGFVPAVLHRTERRAAMLRSVEQAALLLAQAEADVLVLAAALDRDGYEGSHELSDEEWQSLIDGLSEVQRLAAQHGLALALHPHYGTAIERRHQVERLLATSDVSLCLDTGHLLLGGSDPVEITRGAGERIAHVHFKDVDATLAARVRAGELGYRDAVGQGLYRALGDGDVDIYAVVEHLEDSGYRGWYVLEQDVVLEQEPEAGNGPAGSAARSVDYLLRITDA